MIVAYRKWVMMMMMMALTVDLGTVSGEYFSPFNVSYDHRALIIGSHRRMLISAGIHYPRATAQMWPDLIAKSKVGGADVIETYVFWNGHEPEKGQYNFEGRYDIVKFVKLVGSNGMYMFLRIGPYACAEWNFGGFPVWLRDVPGVEFRTNNAPFKEEMQRFVKKIVDMMLAESLFSWQGGPIIMAQIENEYGNLESSYGRKGKEYMQWAAQMAVGLGAGVPWVMCRQTDAPEFIIDSCNAYYCDGFQPNSDKKPILWTENWVGWYTDWGERLPHRPVEDIAFAVARFFQRGGSFMNYYMYFGGTNFARTAGGPNIITSYDYDAPIDEYGLLSQPKFGHLKELHAAIKLCEPALVAADSPEYIKLGEKQENGCYGLEEMPISQQQFLSFTSQNKSHIYRGVAHSHLSGEGICSAFLANIDEQKTVDVKFLGQTFTLPPWSVTILPDCKNPVFNTAQVGSQTSIKRVTSDVSSSISDQPLQHLMIQKEVSGISKTWTMIEEPIGVWGSENITFQGVLEHLNVTKDQSDYLWYMTRIYVPDSDISFWEENEISPTLSIDSMRDFMRVFINGRHAGSAKGDWVKVLQPLQLSQGFNDIVLLSETVGLQNYGAFLEKDGAGFRGQVKLSGFKNGDIDLTQSSWTYQIGLQGEFQKFYAVNGDASTKWVEVSKEVLPAGFSWYKAHFDAPDGTDPVVLDLSTMSKGQAWVNGHHMGRYWTLTAPKDGCQENCDYCGAYNENKCTSNCGKPTQTWYHIPRSWLQPSDNLLVIFEETDKTPFDISLKIRFTGTVCGQVSENHYPSPNLWDQLQSSTNTPAAVHLQCDPGHTISSIEFASYGTPQGSCQKFSKGSCHASNSELVVSEACQGKNSCSISVSNDAFGDPCNGVTKTLAVEVQCSAYIGSSASM